jgi:ketosteroid isomerase-like protein
LLTISEYISSGDNVVTVGRYSGLVTATGKRFDCALVHVFTIRDGKIARFLNFTDSAKMVDAYAAAAH